MFDPYANLPIIGHGPAFWTRALPSRWRRQLSQLRPGDIVDVLLDDGRIVRSALRAVRLNARGTVDANRCSVWVDGIVGSYAAHRVRPVNGWWRTPGISRLPSASEDPR